MALGLSPDPVSPVPYNVVVSVVCDCGLHPHSLKTESYCEVVSRDEVTVPAEVWSGSLTGIPKRMASTEMSLVAPETDETSYVTCGWTAGSNRGCRDHTPLHTKMSCVYVDCASFECS